MPCHRWDKTSGSLRTHGSRIHKTLPQSSITTKAWQYITLVGSSSLRLWTTLPFLSMPSVTVHHGGFTAKTCFILGNYFSGHLIVAISCFCASSFIFPVSTTSVLGRMLILLRHLSILKHSYFICLGRWPGARHSLFRKEDARVT